MKPEQTPSTTPPEGEGLLEKAAKRIEEAPGTDEGRAAIAKAQELLALPEDQAKRSEVTPMKDRFDGSVIGSVIEFAGDAERGIPSYRVDRNLEGQISEVSVQNLIKDPKDPLKMLSKGLVVRSETFNARGELIAIVVNAFDQKGNLEKSHREHRRSDGSKTIDIFEHQGRGRVQYMDRSGREQYRDSQSYKNTEIIMGSNGKLQQARIEEVRDDERASLEFIDNALGTKYIYNKALGISRVERLAA